MKVILTKNVPKLGEVGDICEVASGYGRNYLIPQGMAILATAGARRQVDDLKRTERRRLARLRSDAEQLAERIAGTRLEFWARVGETGRLYGSITAADIAEALAARIGVEIDRRKIHLEEPLRTLGEHEVMVHLLPQVEASIVVNVEAEAEATSAARSEPQAADRKEDSERTAAFEEERQTEVEVTTGGTGASLPGDEAGGSPHAADAAGESQAPGGIAWGGQAEP